MARFAPVSMAALALLAGCAQQPGGWDGRRGYNGTGDYGYDLNAPRRTALAEANAYRARAYRARAAGAYRAPGPPGDPWGPHIRTASSRFRVPEPWIRAVMRQESGGRITDASGEPITSPAGAMGLMQVMPRTYETLAARHGLGADPYDPRDNILAGAAYLREMYDRFGAPYFLAAYNAGPDRVEAYLAGAAILPDETVNYLASVAPRLGVEPARRYAGLAPAAEPAAGDAAYAGGGLRGAEYFAADDPAARAFEGGGLVTPDAPTGRLSPGGR